MKNYLAVLATLIAFAFIVSAAQAQSVAWTQRFGGPSLRNAHAMVYDAGRGVTVLFGGATRNGYIGDTWEWNGIAWTQRLVSGPSSRHAHAMAYDAARGVTVLFGGFTSASGNSGETWEWNGTVWTQRAVSGPTPRYGHAMTYDAARGVTVLFGGHDGIGETWEWNGSVWTQRMATGPAPRHGHAMIYDSARGVTVLFGGSFDIDNTNIADTWEWNGTAWTQRAISGPSPRVYHAMAYDAARGVTLLFGGLAGSSNGETWEWNGTVWNQRVVAGPLARYGHAMTFDVVRGTVVLFGGDDSNGYAAGTSDTWAWNGTAWTPRSVSGPSRRAFIPMAYDSARGVAILFGGAIVGGGSNETWEWNGATWTRRSTSGPTPRHQSALAYDSARGVTVLFGGHDDQTWEWDGTSWTQRVVSGPSPRYDHAMTYDTARGITVLFGGFDDHAPIYQSYSDTWEWNGTVWTQRAVSGPAPRYSHAMAYDSARGVTVLFGGNTADGNNGETWEWNGAVWTQRVIGVPPSSLPSQRAYHAIAYDAARGVSVLFGGQAGDGYNDETWELGVPCVAPSITSQPIGHIICRDGSASFTSAAAGTSPFTYQWQVQTAAAPFNTWQTLSNDPGPLPCGGSAFATPINSPGVSIGVRPCPGGAGVTQHFQIRCVVSDACGASITSNQATYTICPADFNCSGSLTINDIFAFLSAWFASDSHADFNGVNGINISDIFAFLDAWFAGCL